MGGGLCGKDMKSGFRDNKLTWINKDFSSALVSALKAGRILTIPWQQESSESQLDFIGRLSISETNEESDVLLWWQCIFETTFSFVDEVNDWEDGYCPALNWCWCELLDISLHAIVWVNGSSNNEVAISMATTFRNTRLWTIVLWYVEHLRSTINDKSCG